MKEFSAAEVTRNTGDVFAAAAAEPVAITKHRKPSFVVLTVEAYAKLQAQGEARKVYAVEEVPDSMADDLVTRLEADLNNS